MKQPVIQVIAGLALDRLKPAVLDNFAARCPTQQVADRRIAEMVFNVNPSKRSGEFARADFALKQIQPVAWPHRRAHLPPAANVRFAKTGIRGEEFPIEGHAKVKVECHLADRAWQAGAILGSTQRIVARMFPV